MKIYSRYDSTNVILETAGANLRGANLYEANLYEANLRGANLHEANLYKANLRGANLRGAKIGENLTLIGERPLLQLGPLGSGGRTLMSWCTDQGLWLQTGCFNGTPGQFIVNLDRDHPGDVHAIEYRRALIMAISHFELWGAQ